MGVTVSANSQEASHHEQQIARCGGFTSVRLSIITGGNPEAITQANDLGRTVGRIFERYQSVLRHSARSITVISNNMISFDLEAARQMQ